MKKPSKYGTPAEKVRVPSAREPKFYVVLCRNLSRHGTAKEASAAMKKLTLERKDDLLFVMEVP